MGTDEPRARRAGRRPARRELPADEKPSGAGTLAAKIDRLFRATHPGGGEHGYTAVASAIRRRGGPTISHTYLWQLRRGLRDNPTKQHLEALADFFGVPPSYFFDDAAGPWTEADLELRAASRDGRVRRLALLAHGLSARSLDALADMAELARRAERLDAPHRRETPTGDDGPAARP